MQNSKSLLAKLLATENITIRREATASTASFNVKDRVLIMPVWKGVSEDLEDMLVVHEVGHALDTPCDGWLNAINKIVSKYHDKPTNRHSSAVKGFLNVIEDARIDKRQKRRYPGSRRNYLAGYKELIERGFFGPTNRDFNTMSFIDRINIYFKGGVSLGIKFSSEEMPFVKRIENAETFEDVLNLADEVYGYSKMKGDDKRETPDDIEYDQDDESEGEIDDFDDEAFENSDDDRDGDKSDDETGDGDAEGKDGEDDEDGEGEPDESDKSSDRRMSNKEGHTSDIDGDEDFIPESETEKVWSERQTELSANDDVEYRYITMPKVNLGKVVDDYKIVLKENEEFNAKDFSKEVLSIIAQDFNKIKNDENNSISFMVKEFEMRKAADAYSKISIAKTGVIDTNKLHSYRYNDDIFRRTTTIPEGKNHGFMMFLDWSGSMTGELKSTVRQLLSMVLFCKRIQVPFEVYTFRDINRNEAGYNFTYYDTKKQEEAAKDYFTFKKGDMKLAGFKLRNILSSRMSLAELNRAFVVLWNLARMGGNEIEPMNGTPLNAAILAASEMIKDFRKRNRLQIVNTIFLTDGGSNPIMGLYDVQRSSFSSYRTKKRNFITDEETKKEYYVGDGTDFKGETITSSLLSILKDRTGCNLIGFYLFTGYASRAQSVYRFFYGASDNEKHMSEMTKSWSNNKFMPVSCAGYDEYYVINGSAMKDVKNNLEIDSSMTKGKVAKAFRDFASKKTVNRVLLQRFIALTAKTAA